MLAIWKRKELISYHFWYCKKLFYPSNLPGIPIVVLFFKDSNSKDLQTQGRHIICNLQKTNISRNYFYIIEDKG